MLIEEESELCGILEEAGQAEGTANLKALLECALLSFWNRADTSMGRTN
jgi:hypothetical protein